MKALLVALLVAVALSAAGSARSLRTPVLSHVPGEVGCLSSRPVVGCARLREAAFIGRLWADPRVTGDGRSIYMIADGALSLLRRDPSTGGLGQLGSKPACIAWNDKRCQRVADFAPSALAVSPDGDSLYVASADTDYAYGHTDEWTRLDVLRRDPRDGALSRRPGPGDCFANPKQVTAPKPKGCTAARGLRLPQAVLVSPDGRFVYVASWGGISVYRRREAGGLEQLAGKPGCLLAETGTPFCSARRSGMSGTYALTMSGDGRDVYALVAGNGSADFLLVFARDARTGALTPLAGRSGCLAGVPRVDCRFVSALTGRYWDTSMALSPDGRGLYFANGSEIVTLGRRLDGTLEARGETTPLRRLGGWDASTSQTTISPDGRSVYLLSPGGVLTFVRDTRSGDLSEPGCLSAEPEQGCERIRPTLPDKPDREAAASVNSLTVSADGRHLYIVGESRSGTTYITVYARAAGR